MVKNKPTLCWDCKKACCGCSWSSCFIPVGGWVARPTKIKKEGDKHTCSYVVAECPQFERDAVGAGLKRINVASKRKRETNT